VEGAERESGEASKAAAAWHRGQAISDLEAIFDEASPFLLQAIPDLNIETLQPYPDVNGSIFWTQRLTFESTVIEFHIWHRVSTANDPYAHHYMHHWGGVSESSRLNIPIILPGVVLTGNIHLLGTSSLDRTMWYSSHTRRIADLACGERSGRLEWLIYRFARQPEHTTGLGMRPPREPLDLDKVEPLTTATIAATLEEVIQAV
jgi:hypothetical protein